MPTNVFMRNSRNPVQPTFVAYVTSPPQRGETATEGKITNDKFQTNSNFQIPNRLAERVWGFEI